jgi:hypothetical protein
MLSGRDGSVIAALQVDKSTHPSSAEEGTLGYASDHASRATPPADAHQRDHNNNDIGG